MAIQNIVNVGKAVFPTQAYYVALTVGAYS